MLSNCEEQEGGIVELRSVGAMSVSRAERVGSVYSREQSGRPGSSLEGPSAIRASWPR